MRGTCISMKCYDKRVEGILHGKLYAPIVIPEDPRSLPMQSFNVKTVFCLT